jgi:phytoene dehydrogenase-like protein
VNLLSEASPAGSYDVIVVGAGPNGLAAAIELAATGHSVCIFEANEIIGGGARSAELTLPGFVHDVCSAVHPLAAGSPFFSKLSLTQYGLEFINPPAPLAHPFDDGTACYCIARSMRLLKGLEQMPRRTKTLWDRLWETGVIFHTICSALFASRTIR